ncbi:NAD-dependent epimerase/dehydratase family protein [Cohnella luojiensis]|uniref:NAD-dependent epimerase/dehydratase family protein n=2 Tax=Cohnella luojiensis TaxID=652876 RepID=A0A4Y8LVD0_9BACL|nr:NAD-dependent epimerase/dehydratase family protein [Cohnella luojiensis]
MASPILITGCAGFIGFHLANRLLKDGYSVIGLDNLNDYYEISLKQSRLDILKQNPSFAFVRASLEDRAALENMFSDDSFSIVLHLAGQAGVRASFTHPHAYVDSNVVGFLNILEACRNHRVGHLMYASSSSVYGANTKLPFSVQDPTDHPLSLYAATKKANELMAHSYSHLYGLRTTGLRLFTAYGPWGRPDMAYYSFTKRISNGIPIQVYNNGLMKRDFTYIDDIVEGVVRLMNQPHNAPYEIYNIGNNQPIELMRLIELIEEGLGKKAIIEYLPMQAAEVETTFADISKLRDATGFSPLTRIEDGMNRFVEWYCRYHSE